MLARATALSRARKSLQGLRAELATLRSERKRVQGRVYVRLAAPVPVAAQERHAQEVAGLTRTLAEITAEVQRLEAEMHALETAIQQEEAQLLQVRSRLTCESEARSSTRSRLRPRP
jgi:hypothetical protein